MVVAVLAQSAEAVRRYVEKEALPFVMLIDASREVMKAYGVWHRVGIATWNVARPSVFLIDRDLAIRYSFIADRQHEFPWSQEIDAAITALPPGGDAR